MGIPWDGMGWGRHKLLWDGMGWDRKLCPMNKPVNIQMNTKKKLLESKPYFLPVMHPCLVSFDWHASTLTRFAACFVFRSNINF